jgi:hypothetical protein
LGNGAVVFNEHTGSDPLKNPGIVDDWHILVACPDVTLWQYLHAAVTVVPHLPTTLADVVPVPVIPLIVLCVYVNGYAFAG